MPAAWKLAGAGAVLAALMAAGPARADRSTELGGYERDALQRALEERALELEPAPEGKVVGRIHVVNLDVFGQDEGFLQFFNRFHRTTREEVIEREVLLRPGEVWSDEVVEDSRRRLNDPLYTTLVVIAPVVAEQTGTVDLLVVTRDMWSLRMNSKIEVQETIITTLIVSLSENNVLGLRKQAAMVFDMDQGSWSLGPLYVDKNVLGSRLQFHGRVRALFSRATDEFEGTSGSASLAYPLWSLRRTWAASLAVEHFDGIRRQFLGADLRLFPLDAMAGAPQIPHLWEQRSARVGATVTRSFGDAVKQHVSAVYELRSDRSAVPDGVLAPPELIDRFEDEVLPRSERTSMVLARYRVFTPRYVRYRNLDSYDLAEDATLGPDATVELGLAPELLGSDTHFVRGAVSAAWTFGWGGDGLVRVTSGIETRLQDGDLIDNEASASLRVATMRLFGVARVVGVVTTASRWDEQGNRAYVLGGESGLRGYPIGAFFTTPGASGHRLVRANLEVRSMPLRVLFTRLGGVLFWDLGGVAAAYRDLRVVHDVGAGLRLLVPQMQPFVFRLDVAVPLNGPTAGFEGTRIIFGSAQAF